MNFRNKKRAYLKKLSIDSMSEIKMILKVFNKKKFSNFSYLNEKY